MRRSRTAATRARRRIIPVAAASLLAAVLTAGLAVASSPAGAAGGIRVPERDPFYAVPANIAQYADGAVIDSRVVDATTFGLPLPADGWQVKYRTEDELGAPTATVTTVLVPKLAWTSAGPRPLLSYQTAEDGVAGRCAPSYALRAGLLAGFSNSVAETSLIGAALLQGWAVTVPDYEGPQSEFLVSGVQARAVLDGIRAARSFTPAGVAASAPLGVWGYSGGSLASITAAQLQPSYAPDVHLTAIAVGGLVADIRASINAFDGGFAGGAVPMGINGFLRHYPELNLLQYLNASGRRKVARTAGDCIVQAAARYPFLKISSIVSAPNALDSPPVVAMLNENSPLFRSGVPQAPIYHYQAVADELAPIGPARTLLHQFCAAGVVVQSVEPPGGEHIEETIAGAPGALQFLARRFAGDAPVNTCATIPN